MRALFNLFVEKGLSQIMQKKELTQVVTLLAAVLACLSGFCFGYDAGAMAAGILFIRERFSLSSTEQGALISTVIFGALIISPFSGALTKRLSLKTCLQLSACLFVVGFFLIGYAQTTTQLFIGKFINGLAGGIACAVAPVYISDIAPAKKRGLFVSCFQLLLCLGIALAFVIAWRFSASQNWRSIFFIGMIPAVIYGLLFFTIPFVAIQHPTTTLDPKQIAKDIPKTKNRFRLVTIGVVLSIFQQICGINAVMYYAPTIFQSLKWQDPQAAALQTSICIGAVNLIFTLPTLLFSDRIGRKTLLAIGFIGMSASLFFLSLSFIKGWELSSIAVTLFFVAFFAFSIGPLLWVVLPELFPQEVKNQAMGLSVMANNLANFLVAFSFLPLTQFLSMPSVFLGYSFISLIGFIFILKFVPETKAS